jgi:hypothetical protein
MAVRALRPNGGDQRLAILAISTPTDFIASPLHRLVRGIRSIPRNMKHQIPHHIALLARRNPPIAVFIGDLTNHLATFRAQDCLPAGVSCT